MNVMSVWSVAMGVFHCEGDFLCNREAPNIMTELSLNLSVY